ncbi:MAG: transglutaminase domain-containing protein [Candidatus Micrarchaeota archaeon]
MRLYLILTLFLFFGCTHSPEPELKCGEHSLGERWLSDDGCNTCTCTETGTACTEMACLEDSCGTVLDKACSAPPLYCDKGNLMSLCQVCGCPPANRCEADGTCTELKCNDSTLEGECSERKPLKCVGEELVERASECGCPEDYRIAGNSCEEIMRCDDGTEYGVCSAEKPEYCKEGELVERASECGCPEDHVSNGEECIHKFYTGPVVRDFSYVLGGEEKTISMEVYSGLDGYLEELERVYYCDPECPSNLDLELMFIDQEDQRGELSKLVEKIRGETYNEDDQARIAISLVQHIPYDQEAVETGITNRYPYEVIFDNKGVCGEKSRLLAFLLRGLGYGTALFTYTEEKHQAVGLECPAIYSYKSSGYCFVESTIPSIITNDQGEYSEVGKLKSTPLITEISEGDSFEGVKEEYDDARTYKRISAYAEFTSGLVDPHDYYLWGELMKKYGMNANS